MIWIRTWINSVVSTVMNGWYPQHAFHLIRVLLPTDAHENYFKRVLKFTLKQLQHVSVQSPSSGSAMYELAKLL